MNNKKLGIDNCDRQEMTVWIPGNASNSVIQEIKVQQEKMQYVGF
jgi:hypothetical protein